MHKLIALFAFLSLKNFVYIKSTNYYELPTKLPEKIYTRNAIVNSIKNNNLIKLKHFLKHINMLQVNSKNLYSRTFLHEAVYFNNIKAVEILLKYNANPNIQDINQETPLHKSIRFGYIDIAKLLINYNNANLNIQDQYGYTPLHNAIHFGLFDIAKILINKDNINLNLKDNKYRDVFSKTSETLVLECLKSSAEKINAIKNSYATIAKLLLLRQPTRLRDLLLPIPSHTFNNKEFKICLEEFKKDINNFTKNILDQQSLAFTNKKFTDIDVITLS